MMLIGLSSTLFMVGPGCGTVGGAGAFTRGLLVAECEGLAGLSESDVDIVVLDWDGGTSPIYPDETFVGVDLSLFETADGGTLADQGEAFKELVRQRIAEIYCDSPADKIIVYNGDDVDPFDTVVHITHETRPNGSTDIGEGEYDPCNRQTDNAALIFGERLNQLSGAYTFDEWVNVFANVCAHEIGHTLGFGHVVRSELDSSERALFVELMLDRHTMSEMRQPHKFIVEQDNCPADANRSRRLAGEILPCLVEAAR